MASVWVYNWNHSRGGTGVAWGHSSLWIEGGAYVSWWPEQDGRQYMVDQDTHPRMAAFLGKVIGTTNVYKVKHRCNPSYQHDVIDEGRGADLVVRIADGVLDTKAMQLWWAGYAYESASYHVIKKNCSTTVIRALRAGGSDQHTSGFQATDFLSKRKGWEPTDIVAYLRDMNRKLGDKKVDLSPSMNTLPKNNKPLANNGGVAMCEYHNQPLLTCSMC
ncbi:hypothetical protein [Falsiroseomonas sp. E2-1-a20]|uniref:hypothetical protein n=1 Tax=Falsiroseomonas sp. E2-1-a20 TaxID=3239300 RepID=UPI003F2A8C3D